MEDFILTITGGNCPGKYRSTSLKITGCRDNDRDQAYLVAKRFAKTNFPDYNHMEIVFKPNPIMNTLYTLPASFGISGLENNNDTITLK